MAKVVARVLGGEIKEVTGVNTVADVKSRLGASNHKATVNGEPAEDTYTLSDEDFVSLAPAVKGGC